jgi:uncharacterized protein (DUF58 family)
MILPTPRAALLAAIAAPAALVVAAAAPGAWVVAPAAGVVLLVLLLLDAALAGRVAEWRVVAPPDAEIGEPLAVTVMADMERGMHRSLEAAVALQYFLRDAEVGLIARRIRGEGTQFEALSEYEPGMDRRRIDWKTSSRHTKLYARENESERNNQIVFAFDCGQAMCEPVDGLPRIDRAVTAALTAAYVAMKGGDRVSLFGFARRPQVMTPFYGETRRFHRLQTAAAGLDYHAEEANFTLALATLGQRLQRRSLIVLFSDFTDPTSAELMIESLGRLTSRHLVLFVTIEDSELAELQAAEPDSLDTLATAVAADTLARQRALVLLRLRQLGIYVIEAPWNAIGYRLIDRYLEIKRKGSIG